MWDADDIPGGIYFCRLEMYGVARTMKMVLKK
jgi:hypothetical protein